MLLGVFQGRARTLDIDSNLAAIDAAAARAAAAGARVLLTPELFPVGYSPERIRRELDPAVLPALADRLAGIARGHRLALVYSLPAVQPNGDWNITATLVDRTGTELLRYAKVHLFGPAEREAFAPADQPPAVVDFEGFKTSLLICYDVEFPEQVRAAATRGAELLLVPTALGHGYESVPQVLLRARALESQLAIGYANHCEGAAGAAEGLGEAGVLAGGSVVVGPDGGLLAQAGSGEELVFAEVGHERIERARADVPYLSERRPDLYARWESS